MNFIRQQLYTLIEITGLLFLLVTTACQQPAALLPDEEQVVQPVMNTEINPIRENVKTIKPEPLLSPANNSHQESLLKPNWKARAKELYMGFKEEFVPPKTGSLITLTLQDGTRSKGTLVSIYPAHISLRKPQGIVTYRKKMLSKQSRIKLYEEDYAKERALHMVKKEKWNYQESQRKLNEDKKINAAKGKAPVNDMEHNGAVWQVVGYMRNTLRYPESTHFIKWHSVKKTEKGYAVRVKYSTDTDSFGSITEQKLFFLNEQGNVIRTAGYHTIRGRTE